MLRCWQIYFASLGAAYTCNKICNICPTLQLLSSRFPLWLMLRCPVQSVSSVRSVTTTASTIHASGIIGDADQCVCRCRISKYCIQIYHDCHHSGDCGTNSIGIDYDCMMDPTSPKLVVAVSAFLIRLCTTSTYFADNTLTLDVTSCEGVTHGFPPTSIKLVTIPLIWHPLLQVQ